MPRRVSENEGVSGDGRHSQDAGAALRLMGDALDEDERTQRLVDNESFFRVQLPQFVISTVFDGSEDLITAQISTKWKPLSYKMSHARRGYAVIINNEIFMSPDLANRDGSLVDVENLQSALKILGFHPERDIKVKSNLTGKQIHEHVREVASWDHTDCDCLMLVIMSHGTDKGVLGSDDDVVNLEQLYDYLDAPWCPTLVGKPKIIMIQACRGRRYQNAYQLQRDAVPVPPNTQEGRNPTTTPPVEERQIEESSSSSEEERQQPQILMPDRDNRPFLPEKGADLLVSYATVPGYVTLRDPAEGTWFVRAVCEAIRENGPSGYMEFPQILVYATNIVTNRFMAKWTDRDFVAEYGYVKQQPVYETSLSKFLFFPQHSPFKEFLRRHKLLLSCVVLFIRFTAHYL